jgi:hypothetical protein
MPRKPIGVVAMTPAERARRYRARQRERPTVAVDQALETASAALAELWTALLHAGPVNDTADLRSGVDAARDEVHGIRIALIHRTNRKTGRVTGPAPEREPTAA